MQCIVPAAVHCGCIAKTSRVRFRCGHVYCKECLVKVEYCLVCLTPAEAPLQTPFPDDPATKRAQNAANLLKAFEDTFDIDVYKRSRISEQLKIEKEVFPDCIQAPVKYHNKRKSSIYQSDKENSRPSFFPGEQISPVRASKMENSFNYVQNWLDNNVSKSTRKSYLKPRKPLNDLNVNSPSPLKRKVPRRADLILDKAINQPSKENAERTPKKKRKLGIKTALAKVESQSLLDRFLKPVDKSNDFTKIKKGFDESPKASTTRLLNKTDKDESGIVIDDDPIVIDDSQSQVVDKDKLAWLAVLEANERSPYVSQTLRPEELTEIIKEAPTVAPQAVTTYKVPFIKRSYLIERCDLCIPSKSDIVKKKQVAGQSKDVSITIESTKFITTIKMSTVKDKPVFEKHSVPVQTEACDLFITEEENISEALNKEVQDIQSNAVITQNVPLECKEKEVPSQDMFTAEMLNSEDHKLRLFTKEPPRVSPRVIIEDSDSDCAIESSVIEVEAQIHHSSENLEAPILAELDQSEVQQRANRSGRGITPNSTDSSDKENFDPNKSKRIKHDKKNTKNNKGDCKKYKKL
ncbi:hypothetical protein NE865_08536 [Phthorimaea operculella]|nr:hypothetical protein NE865_08536 [Phthorimaea operculella]